MRFPHLAWRLLLLSALAAGCSDPEPVAPPADTALEDMMLVELTPGVLVPGSRLVVRGSNFVPSFAGATTLHLEGAVDGTSTSLLLTARFVEYDRLEVTWTGDGLPFPDGIFTGEAWLEAESALDERLHRSPRQQATLAFGPSLEPRPDGLTGEVAFVNDRISVQGEGFLLGGDEGRTLAVVEGCFRPQGAATCDPIAPAEVVAEPARETDRSEVVFPFSPTIAGIEPGDFEGTVKLLNRHASMIETESAPLPLTGSIAPPVIEAFSAEAASLGQYVSITGRGFVGPRDDDPLAVTTIEVTGTFTPTGGMAAPTQLNLIAEYVRGDLVRYVLNEEDELGQGIDLRQVTGTFDGTAAPTVSDGSQAVTGDPVSVTFGIAPVKQVVWLRYRPTYVESLRLFGLRAADTVIRDRVRAVVERDYAGINLELRAEEPTDFALFSEVELSGPDPNGIGLLGYDNTPGKDEGNLRLYDRIGGVNALTQEDGFPGYGGVFVESLFTFSTDPSVFAPDSGKGTPVFDQIFDPFRPDHGGTPVTEDEVAGLTVLTDGASCPATDRPTQVACAVWTLGNLIGGTLSHEIAHSLGLADPGGEAFHNVGDWDGAIMDSGSERPFLERAELEGQGPAVFCAQNYTYLRQILPTATADPLPSRIECF